MIPLCGISNQDEKRLFFAFFGVKLSTSSAKQPLLQAVRNSAHTIP